MEEQVLSDIRVVEIGEGVGLAFAGRLFADFGADVVKIEPPMGDATRRHGPFPGDIPDAEASGLFLHLNRNKRGITLDVSTPTGQDLFRRLVAEADIVLESFPPGQLAAWGVGFAELHARHPRLVMGSLTPFGQTGPYAGWQGNDIVYYAMGGPMNCTGVADLYPVKKALSMVEAQAGNVLAGAVLAAYLVALDQGEGQHVDVAAVETQLGSIDRRMVYELAYQFHGENSSRGDLLDVALPWGIYPCADGYVQIATVGPWVERMLATLDDPDLTAFFREHPGAAFDPAARERIEGPLFAWLLRHTKQECFEEATLGHQWPVFPVNTVEDVVEDPHFRARNFFVTMDHPRAGRLTYPGAPFRMGEGGFRLRRPAPLLGEHNREVYGAVGLSPRDLADLRGLGVI
jgi:crotonobetainyl-CoA:carnitine CoA-transferase CaiB-like acyl-CoA transferase